MTASLLELKDDFVDYLKSSGKSTSTILAYGNDLSQFIEFLSKKQI